MPHRQLPVSPSDVLRIPEADIPEVLRNLVQQRALSGLVARIHGELHSGDPALRVEGRKALDRLGFTD